MAIPLGAPRKDGGLTVPVSFPSHRTEPFTSTPYGQDSAPPPNVGILAMKNQSLEDEEREMMQMAKKKKDMKLEKRVRILQLCVQKNGVVMAMFM
jgi:hypothetical protein